MRLHLTHPKQGSLITMSEASDCKRLKKTLPGASATSYLIFWWHYLLLTHLQQTNCCNNAVNPREPWEIMKTNLYMQPILSIFVERLQKLQNELYSRGVGRAQQKISDTFLYLNLTKEGIFLINPPSPNHQGFSVSAVFCLLLQS